MDEVSTESQTIQRGKNWKRQKPIDRAFKKRVLLHIRKIMTLYKVSPPFPVAQAMMTQNTPIAQTNLARPAKAALTDKSKHDLSRHVRSISQCFFNPNKAVRQKAALNTHPRMTKGFNQNAFALKTHMFV